MGDGRDPLEKLRDNERMENRHAAKKLAEETQRLRDMKDNPRALVASYGVDSSDYELRDEAFDDALQSRRLASEKIEQWDTLDEDTRERLILELSLLSLDDDDPSAEVDAFIRLFRAELGSRFSEFEAQSILSDLKSLRLYAGLSRLD